MAASTLRGVVFGHLLMESVVVSASGGLLGVAVGIAPVRAWQLLMTGVASHLRRT